ncbi:MAG TPA: ABC transporter substrate-binding protein [Herpetosiphonaceae bacterium]
MTRRISLLMIVSLFLGALAGCGGQSAGGANEVIKIGFFGPLSGDSASDGTNARNAAQLAINQANAKQAIPGKTLQLVAYDDKLSQTDVVTAINNLVDNDKVSAVIGGSYSGPTRKAAPLLQAKGIPLLAAYATHPEVTTAGPMVFRVIYTSVVQGKAIGLFSMDKLGHKSFYVLSIDNDYGNSMSDSVKQTIEAKGGTVAGARKFGADEKDFAVPLAEIKAAKADAVILIGYYAQSAEIIKQARAQGIALPIIGSDGLDSPSLLELGGPAVEGVVLATDFSRNDPRPIVQDFIREFQAAYNTGPDVVASSTYDATNLLIEAIKRSNSSQPQAIRDAIAATTTFEGVTGNITFTPDREVAKTVLFVKIEKGSFAFLDKLDPSQLR